MDSVLFAELFSYASSLVVMQRLESRHHLVSMRVAPSRAMSATAISAFLRRKLNTDINRSEFREHFERYLHEFDKLVPEEWASMSELHKLVSGHHLSVMFHDTSSVDALIQAAAPPGRSNSQKMLELQAHVKQALADGGFYALPASASPDGSTEYMVVQMVNTKPEAKKYMERIMGWNPDVWREQVAVAPLGKISVPAPVVVLDADGPLTVKESLAPLPAHTNLSVETTGCVEPVSVNSLFRFGFESVYHFQDVRHACAVSQEAITNAITAADGHDSDSEAEGGGAAAADGQISIAGDPVRVCSGLQIH